MPTFERGNMWDIFNTTDWFLITTNPIINRAGLAVMGRGMAKQAADRFASLRGDMAKQLEGLGPLGYVRRPVRTIGKYGPTMTRIGWFMVKHHWKSHADLDLIASSVRELSDILHTVKLNRVDLNFPGIGNGGMDKQAVIPLLMWLPDNVHIWEYA